MSVAEEGLDAQGVEAVVAGELRAVVEGDRLAPLVGEGASSRTTVATVVSAALPS